MEELKERYRKVILDEFARMNVLVIGDIMLDEYVIGKVKRISPEAPIPVLNFSEKRRVAGGASNVAHNISSLGSHVTMVGVVGKDGEGEWVKNHLLAHHIGVDGVLEEEKRPTTVKRRFATKSQQLLRVDVEDCGSISEDMREKMLSYVEERISQTDAVILSDYRKGIFSSSSFVSQMIDICRKHDVPISIDSKSSNIEAFHGATFVKPNNLELEQAVGIKIEDEDTLDQAGQRYLERSGAKILLVTRGAHGISMFERGKKRKDYPSEAAQVYDVTGAGDTVISAVTLGITGGLSMEEAIILGNIAASIVISKVGTVPVTAKELIHKIYENQNI